MKEKQIRVRLPLIVYVDGLIFYDAQNQLLSETIGSDTTSYTYDTAGNIRSITGLWQEHQIFHLLWLPMAMIYVIKCISCTELCYIEKINYSEVRNEKVCNNYNNYICNC